MCSIEKAPNLKDFYTYPTLERTTNKQPDNIVMIIGESFSKSHSSLYGYEKQTNPYLNSLKETGHLYTFTHAESVSNTTIECFKSIMGAWRPEYRDSCEWYQCTTLQEIMHIANYHTIWISNQSAKGLFDNIVGKYAELCDTSIYVGNKFAGMSRKNLDEETIDIARPLSKKDTQKNMYFIHLMGSHSDFQVRYPNHFNKYQPNDYTAYPQNQRTLLATYDNSILYNDSVVYQLIDLFRNKESIVFYFPDHAIDVYESSKDYIGHGKANVPQSAKAGKQIPFMIYTSPQYQQHFPEKIDAIKKHLDTPFQTDRMMQIIMDIAGIIIKKD